MTKSDLPVAFTGAAGRVGRRVIPFLSQEWNIRGVDLDAGGVEGVEVRAADLLDLDAVVEAFRGAGAIVHSAIAPYPMGAPHDNDDPVRKAYNYAMLEVNIKGTFNVFEAARILKIPRMVYISSMTVVTGHISEYPTLEESLPLNPNDLYACTKIFGEQLAKVYSRSHQVRSLCLRLGQPYPLGHPQEEEWRRDPYTRAFLVTYSDIAKAIECALAATDVSFGIYNIVSRNGEGVLACAAAGDIGFAAADCL